MTVDDIFAYYGGRKDAVKALKPHGWYSSLFSNWIKLGKIPYGRQCELQVLTDGKLMAVKDNAEVTGLPRDGG